jgi:hypothetical protein
MSAWRYRELLRDVVMRSVCTLPPTAAGELFRTSQYPNLPTLAARAGKAGYIQHATAVRKPGDSAPELSGPGTALMELDEAAHCAIGVAAAAVTTWLATRASR